jgi:hypothetical protein
MGAAAPSRLLRASRDLLQALAIIQETPLAPCLICLRAAGFLLEDCRLFADGFLLEDWRLFADEFLLEDRKETVQTVGCSVWYIGDWLEILLHSVAVFQMVFPNG